MDGTGRISRRQGRHAWDSLRPQTRREILALAQIGKRVSDCETQLKVSIYVSGLLKSWWKDEVATTIVPLALAIAALGVVSHLTGLPNSYLSGGGLLIVLLMAHGAERGRVEQLAKIYGYFPDGASLPSLGQSRRFLSLPPRPWPVWWLPSVVAMFMCLATGAYLGFSGSKELAATGVGIIVVGSAIPGVTRLIFNRVRK